MTLPLALVAHDLLAPQIALLSSATEMPSSIQVGSKAKPFGHTKISSCGDKKIMLQLTNS
jgi:hypothetical protein